jgi:hypothetical protein
MWGQGGGRQAAGRWRPVAWEAMAGLLPRPTQVVERFSVDGGDIDGGEVSGAHEPGKLHNVTTVGCDG